MGEGTVEETVFLTYGVHSSLRGPNTLKVALRIINWSLRALYRGTWPTLDWNNKPLNDPKATPLFEYRCELIV